MKNTDAFYEIAKQLAKPEHDQCTNETLEKSKQIDIKASILDVEEAKGRDDKMPVNEFLQKVLDSMSKKLKQFIKKNTKNEAEPTIVPEINKEVTSSENDWETKSKNKKGKSFALICR